MRVLTILGLVLILLTGCSQRVIYIHSKCAFVEPIDVNISTNSIGGLDPSNALKAINGLRYYGKECRRLKAMVKGNK